MANHPDIENILFLDIETVPKYEVIKDLDDREKKLWDKKIEWKQKQQAKENGKDLEDIDPQDFYIENAPFYPEFGKTVCVCVGMVDESGEGRSINMASFADDNEEQILEKTSSYIDDQTKALGSSYGNNSYHLCAHNGSQFDYPFLAKRMIINQVPLPALLDTYDEPSWRTNRIDTVQLWRFGKTRGNVSLDLLAHLFDIPTPKDDIDGGDIYNVFYKENDLERITKYCKKDVETLIRIYTRMIS